MKKICSILLILCLVMTFSMPVYAQEPEAEPPSEGICESTLDLADSIDYYTRIELYASDHHGNPLAGVTWGLYRWDGTLVQELTTGEDGTAISMDVSVYYDYFLIEHSRPDEFKPNTERQEILLDENCAPSKVRVEVDYEPIEGQIKIIKTDEYGNPMQGIGFSIIRHNGWETVDYLYTDWSGEAITGMLEGGGYSIYEDVPWGYSPDYIEDVYINEDGQVYERYVVNYHDRGDLRIYKYGTDGRPIEGAVFSIYRRWQNADQKAVPLLGFSGGEWIEDITTDRYGYAYSSGLVLGSEYYAVEKSVPAPYVLDTTRYYFSFDYNGQRHYLDIENEVEGDEAPVTVIKTDDRDRPLEGVVFGLYRAWDDHKLGDLTTAEDGTVTSDPLIPNDYYLIEESGLPGYEMVDGQIPFTIDGSGETVEVPVVNPKIRIFGQVKITKTDDGGVILPGVVFGLYCEEGNLLQELEVGEDGTVTSKVLRQGSYYVRELTGVPGHQEDDTEHHFSIETNGVVVELDIVNTRITGSLLVTKTDDEGEPLAGVVFGIYDKVGNLVESITSGMDGTASSGPLHYGTYKLREESGLPGFLNLGLPVSFEIQEQDEVVELDIVNERITGTLLVNKTDEDSEPLAGVAFGIYDSDGVLVETITSGQDGTATSGPLNYGAYELREESALTGFLELDLPVTFEIQKQDEVVELDIVNERITGTLLINKTDEDGEPLAGVVFGIYASGGSLVETITSGQDGSVTSGPLNYGAYELREESALPGFLILDMPLSFKIQEQDEVVELDIVNQKDEGELKLIKTDEDGKALDGVVFSIYASDGKWVADLTTKNGGLIEHTLPTGRYYAIEKSTLKNMVLDTTSYPFTITAGETAVVKVVNKYSTGSVTVYFRHVDDTRELAPNRTHSGRTGTGYLEWIRNHQLHGMAIEGYSFVRADFPRETLLGTGNLTVTMWYKDAAPVPVTNITIPKTGTPTPILQYVVAAIFLGIGCIAAYSLYRRKHPKQKTEE